MLIVKSFNKKLVFLWIIVIGYVISLLILLNSYKFISDSQDFVVFFFSFFLWEFINLAFDHYIFKETSKINDSNSGELALLDTKVFNNKTGLLIVLVLGSMVAMFFI